MSDSDSGEEMIRRQRKPAFAMLDDSDEEEEDIVEQPKRTKNAMALLADSDDDDEEEEEDDEEDVVPRSRKKASLALLDDSDEEEEEEEEEEEIVPQPVKKGKNKKKKGKKTPAPVLSDSEEDEEAKKEPEPSKPEPKGKGKKGKGKKGKGKKGKGKNQEEEEDIDALLDAVVAENKALKAETGEAPEEGKGADAGAEDKAEEGGGGGKKKKRRRNKKKKGDEDAEEAAPVPSPEPPKPKGKGKKGPPSAIAKKAREQAEKLAAERERQQKEEEERRRQEAEEKKRREEEARIKEEEAAKKREENRLKREKLKKEGRYMTKAQAKKAAIARAQLEKMGAVPTGDKKKHRPLPGKKKKKGGPSTPRSGGSASPLPEPSSPAPDEEEEEEEVAPAVKEEKEEEPVTQAPKEGKDGEKKKEGEEEEEGDELELEIDIDLDDLEGDTSADALVKTIKPQEEETPEEEEKREAIDISRLPLEERIRISREKRAERVRIADENRSPDKLRSPICVVLGHVDTGKTKILDKIRRTNVQEGEAGGITQQIGATYFPMDRLRKQIDKVETKVELEYKVPGLLVVDTPGHESFTNLRSRGTNLCDIAILVVDLMHGLEPQTIESLNLLRARKTPFVVALNKVDRCYGWKSEPYRAIKDAFKAQDQFVIDEFERRAAHVIAQFSEQGLNAEVYFRNKDKRKVVSLIPTSAMTGEGIPDLLYLVTQLTQRMMAKRLMFKAIPEATVLEVKSIEGLGTTIDIVLVNGELREGDSIVVCGMKGPIVTKIRGLLTPHPAKEIRVKGQYVHHKSITAAMGIKIAAQGLEDAVAGTSMYVVHEDDEVEDLKETVMEDFEEIMSGFQREAKGVYVQASTLGSLEALLEYLRTHEPPVPVSNVALGPVHKRDVMAASTMLEHRQEYATILAFDVKVTPEAQQFATEMGVQVFSADIIYHLTDMFEDFLKRRREEAQKQFASEAVFPCMLQIRKDCIFNKRDPIVLGVDVLHGSVRIGTPLCVILAKSGGAGEGGGTSVVELGRVTSLKLEDNPIEVARAGGPAVSIAISPTNDSGSVLYGRQFDHNNKLYSRISRRSIDVLKENFADQMTREEWGLVVHLKKALNIQQLDSHITS